MEMCLEDCCLFTRGSFYIGDYRGPCNGMVPFGCPPSKTSFKNLGNILQATLNINYDKKGTVNRYHSEFDECSRSSISSIQMEIDLGCVSERNLITALYGKSAYGESGSEEEYFYAFCGGVIEACSSFSFSRANPSNVVIESLDESRNVLDTLVEGVDFEIENRMITFIQDYSNPLATDLRISYDYDETETLLIDPFQSFLKNKTILFKGVNFSGQTNQFFDVEFYKVSLSPVRSFNLLSTGEFLTLNLQAEILKFYDGLGTNSYFQIKKGVLV